VKEVKQAVGDKTKSSPAMPKRRRGRLVIFAAIPLVLVASAATTYFFVPAVADTVSHLAASQPQSPPGGAAAPRPQIVDVPEMVVTLPNGGRARQLRIKFSLELIPNAHEIPPTEILAPRVNDALLSYLRTLRDSDLEGGLALDRIRGDLYRRLTLILGPGVLENVLITGLVTG
jgi:flagellar protein FliL